ncbi:hypothetical protein BpHYR1_047364 [Brachionus plicatilis]|uniref:Uncharacterized protein n=1 Tax=Brachionus plicatilis TaxID=10195 RepID=A0A3M7RTX0_BRAPC|nr:hypothetical protein BpHYR1_047364 [Brachionus plicatilis]
MTFLFEISHFFNFVSTLDTFLLINPLEDTHECRSIKNLVIKPNFHIACYRNHYNMNSNYLDYWCSCKYCSETQDNNLILTGNRKILDSLACNSCLFELKEYHELEEICLDPEPE